MLAQKYQQEQAELETRLETLTAQLASTKEQEDGIGKWIDLIKQFSCPSELTADMLNHLQPSFSTKAASFVSLVEYVGYSFRFAL